MSIPSKIDIVKEGLARLPTQWQDKPVTIGLLKSFLENIQVVENLNCQLLDERGIDTAVGVQLDNLGLIVGQPREVEDGAYALYFGFLGNPNGTGFNDAPFYEDGEPLLTTKVLDDSLYRLYIKARAASNRSSGTPEDVIRFFQALFGGDTNTIVEDDGIAHAIVSVGHIFSDEELLIVKSDATNGWIPRPAGVSYTIRQFTPEGYFGFAGNPQAAGFGVGSFMHIIGNV